MNFPAGSECGTQKASQSFEVVQVWLRLCPFQPAFCILSSHRILVRGQQDENIQVHPEPEMANLLGSCDLSEQIVVSSSAQCLQGEICLLLAVWKQ